MTIKSTPKGRLPNCESACTWQRLVSTPHTFYTL
jgi:hypothetical protein